MNIMAYGSIQNFHPEKYAALCKILSAIYNASGDPVKVMEAYLNTFIDGKTDKFDASTYEIKQSYLATSIKGTEPHKYSYMVLTSHRYYQSI